MSNHDKEFAFSEDDFEQLRVLVKSHTGILLSESKQDMVYGRLARRLRVLKLSDFSTYIDLLEKDDEEVGHLANAISTNLTSFFRESHHFDYLRDVLLPELMRKKQDSRKIRIWSAGCSTGEEPYSLAMTVSEVLPADWDVKILATDLDTNVIETARAGIYTAERVAGVDAAYKQKYMLRGKGDQASKVKMRSGLQDLITFKPLNLLHPWPVKGPFDVIFCRNVMIYFDKPTQTTLLNGFANVLASSGKLFIGHSENIFKVSDAFELLGQTIYQRKH